MLNFKNKSFYIYNSRDLSLKSAKLHVLFIFLLGSFIGILAGININETEFLEHEKIVMLMEKDSDEFSEEKLIKFLEEINVKFSDIVYAQAVLESGNFKSKIFLTNNNLFGMKLAAKRPTLAKGTELNHAFYDSWRDCVLDYAFYQARYLSNIKTREDYIKYLAANYAEDPQYLQKIINLTQRAEKIKNGKKE